MTILDLAAIAQNRGAIQKSRELAALGLMSKAWGLNTMLEVGTLHGWTAWFFQQLGLKVTAIDVDLSQVRVPQDGINFIQGNSVEVAPTLGDFDLIFIDGDHSYEGVSQDWNLYAPKVNREGGLVALHDIVEHPPETGCEVSRLWAAIETNMFTVTIIDPSKGSNWAGIGVVPC